MIEAGVTIGVALFTGLAVLTNRLHSRISDLDNRIDKVELRVATDYVAKSEFGAVIDRLESHMIRIENKLDNLIKS